MFNVLVANADNNQRVSYCQYLNQNSKKLNIIGVENGVKALNTYNEINPSALVMDTEFSDLSCTEIINKLSSTKKESKKCNIIITTNFNTPISTISNTEKIYKILFKPIEFKDLKVSVDNICLNSQIPELDELQLQIFLLDLKFNINSLSTKYLIEAIHQCYYSPYLLGKLDDIIRLIAYKFNEPEKTIKSAFRNSLKPINNYRNNITKSEFINLFDPMRNISPRYFLEVITTYLHKKNNSYTQK